MTEKKYVYAPKSIPVSMRLPEELIERLDVLASKRYISRNAALCQAIGYWCDNQEVQDKLTSVDNLKDFFNSNPDLIKELIKND